jgi:hypothetical protein
VNPCRGGWGEAPRLRALTAGAALVLTAVISGAGCGSTQPTGPVTCGSESRERVDCTSEVSYQGAHTEGGFGIQQMVSANAKHEEVALRRVDEETERFISMQTRLCRDYNACVLDRETYTKETRIIRDRVQKVPALADAVKNAKSDEERRQALNELYQTTVSDEHRVEEVSFRLSMDAILPDSVGGGQVVIKPGMPLPTKARVAFELDVSKDAHVYIFQKAPDGAVTVLFPNAKIGTANPLKGGQRARIPGGDKRFVVNDKDLGIENVFVAVSYKPLSNLEASLARFSNEKATSIKEDNLLQSFTTIEDSSVASRPECKQKTRALELEGAAPAPGSCSQSRGLMLEGPAESGGGGGGTTPPASMSAVTEAGDGLIVKVFSFEHTTEQNYAQAKAAVSSRPKTRGDVLTE